jgi:hypothetical protein
MLFGLISEWMRVSLCRLHADNDHLFWHATLPPHVVTLFLPGLTLPSKGGEELAASDDGVSSPNCDAADIAKVGWTAFLPGTHTVEGAAKALADSEKNRAERILRPRLTGLKLFGRTHRLPGTCV